MRVERMASCRPLPTFKAAYGAAVNRRTTSTSTRYRATCASREVVNSIQHHRVEVGAAAELDPLYADLYDHLLRVSESTESLRDMITTIFETNLSLQDARLNTVMKKLTGWAAIVAVPTAITGFYGQNVPYPGFGTAGGFLSSSSVILVLMVVLYVIFRRRDWL